MSPYNGVIVIIANGRLDWFVALSVTRIMLSDLLPSSESDSEGDVGSSQRDVGEGDEVGEGKDGPYVVKTQENRELGAVRRTHTAVPCW